VIFMSGFLRAEALFLSALQPSDHPDFEQIEAAIRDALCVHGGDDGCAADFAAEYGDHPDLAYKRMRWALASAA
jgi:hypothetical protein